MAKDTLRLSSSDYVKSAIDLEANYKMKRTEVFTSLRHEVFGIHSSKRRHLNRKCTDILVPSMEQSSTDNIFKQSTQQGIKTLCRSVGSKTKSYCITSRKRRRENEGEENLYSIASSSVRPRRCIREKKFTSYNDGAEEKISVADAQMETSRCPDIHFISETTTSVERTSIKILTRAILRVLQMNGPLTHVELTMILRSQFTSPHLKISSVSGFHFQEDASSRAANIPNSVIISVLRLLRVTPLVNVLRESDSEEKYIWYRKIGGKRPIPSLTTVSPLIEKDSERYQRLFSYKASITYNASRAAEEITQYRMLIREARERVKTLTSKLNATSEIIRENHKQ